MAGIGNPGTFLPLTTVTYKYGLTERADIFGGWHVLETFINNGNAFFDVGASYYLLDQKGARPGISAAFTISPLLNAESAWVSFDLQATVSWALGRKERHLLYLGFHNTFSPVPGQVLSTPIYTLSPYLGAQLRLGPKREVGLGLEFKWLRPYGDGGFSTLQFLGAGNYGAFSFVGGLTFYPPGKASKKKESATEETAG